MRNLFKAAAATMMLAWSSTAIAADTKICVYTPAGKADEMFRIMEELEVTMEKKFSMGIQLVTHTDEAVAASDYEAGNCDGVVATGIRLQRFNRFPTTLEAVGALPDYQLLRQAIAATNKYAAKSLVKNEHETAGILPLGAVYLWVNDRSIDTVPELANKKIATLDYDITSKTMVSSIGATMVPADLSTMAPKFNNGSVDAVPFPAYAYKPFELDKGLGSKGGIIKYPIIQVTLQLLVRHDKFPEGFGAASRAFLFTKYDAVLGIIKRAENSIPNDKWIVVNDQERLASWTDMLQSARIQLRDDQKVYHSAMLSMLRKLRCKSDSSRAECVEQRE